MNEFQYFSNSGDPEISVALVGISKMNWIFADENESFDAALIKMSQHRFDVLPIRDNNGEYKRFYVTKKWGNYVKENIETNNISKEGRLYYLTNIHDGIIKFATTKRKYFFLDNQIKINGLITIGNLNCKHVYLYLYNLIIQLEHALGAYIYKQGIKDIELLELFDKRTESSNAIDAVKRYKKDDAKGYDYDFIEYLYLIDLCFIFKHFNLVDKIGLEFNTFRSTISKANGIRNIVAHPNKSLIRDDNSINELHITITGIDMLLEKFRS